MFEHAQALAVNLGSWAGIGATTGGGFFIAKWFVEFLAARWDKRELRLDTVQNEIMEHYRTRLTQVEELTTSLSTQLAECRLKHADSEAKVAKLEAIFAGLGELKQIAQYYISQDRVDKAAEELSHGTVK